MNIATLCLIIGLAIRGLRWFDKDGKLNALVELLKEVDSQLCGGSRFASQAPTGADEKTKAAAGALAEWARSKCDDDCECD